MSDQSLSSELARRSKCPIASALDVIGDKWSLLLVRDIGLFGKHRNKDFQAGAEGIPSNILADRLRRLVDLGLLTKRPYQAHPPRYEYHLTPAGEGLLPVITAMARWAEAFIDGISIPADIERSGR